MSQNDSNPQTPASQAAPSAAGQQEGLPAEVTQDIGAVQGTPPDEDDDDAAAIIAPGSPADRPAPDAGEIEWAGQLVKKPPTPGA